MPEDFQNNSAGKHQSQKLSTPIPCAIKARKSFVNIEGGAIQKQYARDESIEERVP